MSATTKFPVVLIHGAFGYGRSRPLYGRGPAYWPDDILQELNPNHIMVDCGIITSDHDRACETFYQLYGGTVDYGEEHSKERGHHRYGPTFHHPLHAKWSSKRPIHLVGHSCGGTTALELYQLLCQDFFKVGSDASWVRSLTTIASPLTGSTFPYLFGIRDTTSPLGLRGQAFCGVIIGWLQIYQKLPFLRSMYDLRMTQWRDHSLSDLAGPNMPRRMHKGNLFFDILPHERVQRNKKLIEMDKIYLLSIATTHDSAHFPAAELLVLVVLGLLLMDLLPIEMSLAFRLQGAFLLSILLWRRAKNVSFSWFSFLFWLSWVMTIVTKSLPDLFEGFDSDAWQTNDGIINIKSMDRPWFPAPAEIPEALAASDDALAPVTESEATAHDVPTVGHKRRLRFNSHTSVDDIQEDHCHYLKGRWHVYRVNGNHRTGTAWDENARKTYKSLFLLMRSAYEKDERK